MLVWKRTKSYVGKVVPIYVYNFRCVNFSDISSGRMRHINRAYRPTWLERKTNHYKIRNKSLIFIHSKFLLKPTIKIFNKRVQIYWSWCFWWSIFFIVQFMSYIYLFLHWIWSKNSVVWEKRWIIICLRLNIVNEIVFPKSEQNWLQAVVPDMNCAHTNIKNRNGFILLLIVWLILSPLQPLFAHNGPINDGNTSFSNESEHSQSKHCQSKSSIEKNTLTNECEQCSHCLAFPQTFNSTPHRSVSILHSIDPSLASNISLPVDSPPPRI